MATEGKSNSNKSKNNLSTFAVHEVVTQIHAQQRSREIILGGIVSGVIKHVTQRRRPRAPEPGDFFEGGLSFPSGHTTAAWSLATIVACEYRRNRLVQISAYGLAAAASMARFTGRNHFLSDVLVGSAIGYGIGRYVYRTRHVRSSNQDGEGDAQSASRLLPLITPHYNRGARIYGVALSWRL